MIRILFIVALSIVAIAANAQVKIGGNTSTVDARAILELEADNLGTLLTRLTTAQRDTYTGWQAGHLIFNTTDSCFQFYTGITWECLQSTFNSQQSVRLPRRTSSTISGLTNVENGAMVYNTTEKCFQIYVDNEWLCIDGSAVRRATGGGVKASLLENCGCGDMFEVTGGSSGSPTDLGTHMNNYCGLILRYNSSNSTTQYFRLPDPSAYAGKYFCFRNLNLSSTGGNTTFYILAPTGMSSPANRLASLHWIKDLKDTQVVGSVFFEDPSRTDMISIKVISNGTYWFIAAAY